MTRARAGPLLYGGAALGVVALHLVTNGTLGFHTDELYYLDSGWHPALGYVDFPPLVPLLARLETGLLGVSPWTLRVLPTLLGGLMVVLAGAYVRRLGGSLWLQALGILTAVVAPYLLGANWVYQTVPSTRRSGWSPCTGSSASSPTGGHATGSPSASRWGSASR